MPRITRYVLTQLLIAFFVILVGMTIVMLFGIMAREGVRQGLGAAAILRLLPYCLPSALRFAVPATILMATCGVFGRVAADNEIVAIKAMGISPLVMLRPAWGLAVGVSLGLVWLNDVAVTWGADGVRRVLAESVEGVVFRLLRTQRSYSNKNFSIHVRGVEDRKLIQPTLVLRGGANPTTVVAREAELRTNLEQRTLSIFLTDCSIESDGNLLAFPDTYEQKIPLWQATQRDRRTLSPSEFALRKISAEAVRQEALIRTLQQRMAAEAAYRMMLGDFQELGGQRWRQLHSQRREAVYRLNRLRLEPWRRFAEGFSCLFIIVVGAPLAIRMRTANFFTTFASCFMPVLCIYYPLVQWSVDRAKDGAWPPYCVWIGNLVLLALGNWLTRRVVRY